MKKHIITLLVLMLFLTTNTLAVSKVGTTAAQFLKIGVGSRAIGMGGAFVALANDVTALYWNPAGVPRLQNNEVILLHTDWLAGISFDYAGAAVHMGNFGSVGVSITSLSMGEMKVRTELEPEGTGEFFDAGDIAVGLAYGRSLTDRFSIGFNLKYVRQSIWHMAANGVALDIGTLFTTQFNGMTIGMSISNFGPNMKMSGRDAKEYIDVNPSAEGSNDQIPAYRQLDGWALPITFRVGVAMNALKTDMHRMTVALDALHPNDNSESINFGIEYGFNEWAFLRLGWESLFLTDNVRTGLLSDGYDEGAGEDFFPTNAGLGFCYAFSPAFKVKVDYAYVDFGRLNNAQRFSIGIEF